MIRIKVMISGFFLNIPILKGTSILHQKVGSCMVIGCSILEAHPFEGLIIFDGCIREVNTFQTWKNIQDIQAALDIFCQKSHWVGVSFVENAAPPLGGFLSTTLFLL